ncbi:MAG TPA: Crp/Fnr family transcriptional regulator [Candidatus Manganitrophaceae bacterium]|nr:Crp/Fnr family transcriptional regulator [Candidatus Manganitrophaceae bacterium]
MEGTEKYNFFNLFDVLPPAKWQGECPTLSLLTYHDRGLIYRQGEQSGHVFCLLTGYVKLSRINEQGEQMALTILKSGEIFGFPLSDSPKYDAEESARAKGSVQLYKIKVNEFKNLIARTPQMAWRVIQTAWNRQRFLEQRLESMLFKDVRARMSLTLNHLAAQFGSKTAHGLKIDVSLTQQELADLVGASRPVVSTLLNDLKNRGVIEYHNDFICIHRIDTLHELIPSK